MLSQLLAIPSPSGREQVMARQIMAIAQDAGYTPVMDAAGNVLVRLEGSDAGRPPMVLAAHMDEIGMVVTRVDPDGNLQVSRSGALFAFKIGEGPVTVLGDTGQITGVLSFGSTHVAGAEQMNVRWEDAWIVTGLTPAQLAEAGIRTGSTAVPVADRRGPVVFGDLADPLVAAWTFDDRMGVVTLLRLLQRVAREKSRPGSPTVVAFSVQEERGCHGAVVLAQRERPEVFVAVDGCPMPPGCGLTLDGRPAAWSMDHKCHYDQGIIQDLAAAARLAGTSLQTAVLPHAWSDASSVFEAGAAPRVATFGHVRANSHGYEVARLSSFDKALDTLEMFIRGPAGAAA
jgi:putative aminopeptidase FrvX